MSLFGSRRGHALLSALFFVVLQVYHEAFFSIGEEQGSFKFGELFDSLNLRTLFRHFTILMRIMLR